MFYVMWLTWTQHMFFWADHSNLTLTSVIQEEAWHTCSHGICVWSLCCLHRNKKQQEACETDRDLRLKMTKAWKDFRKKRERHDNWWWQVQYLGDSPNRWYSYRNRRFWHAINWPKGCSYLRSNDFSPWDQGIQWTYQRDWYEIPAEIDELVTFEASSTSSRRKPMTTTPDHHQKRRKRRDHNLNLACWSLRNP